MGLSIASFVFASGMLLFDFVKTSEKFPSKFFIGTVDVSNLKPSEAYLKVGSASLESFFPGTIDFIASSTEVFSVAPSDFGISLLTQETVDNAFASSHKGNYFKNLSARLSNGALTFPAIINFSEEASVDIINELAEQINSPPINASIDFDENSGGYHIVPDSPGRKLNEASTFSRFKDSIVSGVQEINLDIEITGKPKITESMLREFPPVHKLSAYTTYYGSHDSPNRIHNIKLIASWLNNTLLMPNEPFSLVNKIGAFTPERGFKEAYVISNNELVPELGGGTCQIGTTLYNAVALADLDILSRRNHSFYFNIYPLGRDATVYPGSADFKFKNNTGHPILIKVVATNRKLSFRVYGTPTGKIVKFSSPSIYLLSEGSYGPASLRTVIAANAPFRTVVIRTVTNSSGEVIKKNTIRSFYKLYGEGTNVPIRRRERR